MNVIEERASPNPAASKPAIGDEHKLLSAPVLIGCCLFVCIHLVRASTPTATTGAASGITTATATLNGTVAPNGLATSAFFQWGPTAAYGNATAPTAVPGGNGSVSLTANLIGLNQLRTYHYQLVTSSSGGRAYGADQSFTTLAQAPVVSRGRLPVSPPPPPS